MEITQIVKGGKISFRATRDEARAVDGMLYQGKKDIYWVPYSPFKIDQIVEFMLLNGIDASKLMEHQYILDEESLEDELSGGVSHHEVFRDYQNMHVERIRRKGGYGLFLEMRLGKTAVANVAVKEENKVIVSVPKGLEVIWQREFAKWAGRDSVILRGSTFVQRKKIYDAFNSSKRMILIVKRDTLARDAISQARPPLKSFDYLIVDEGHFLSNTSVSTKVVNGQKKKSMTLRTDGTQKVGKLARHRLVLTGTPAKKEMHDIIPLLKFVNPDIPGKWDLINYFMGTTKTRFATEINPLKPNKVEEWASWQMQFCGIEKTFEQLKWLQDTQYQTVILEKTPAQVATQKEIVDNFWIKNDSGEITHMIENTMNQLGKIKEVMLDPAIVGGKQSSPKTDWLIDWVKEYPNEPVIVWAKSAKYLKLLSEALSKKKIVHGLSNGSVGKDKRQDLVDRFQEGKINVLLCGIDTMKEGYTIDRADTMVFLERDWEAVAMQQADFRFVDTKKKELHKPKLIIDVQMEESIDQYVEDVYKGKITRTEIANNAHKYLKKF